MESCNRNWRRLSYIAIVGLFALTLVTAGLIARDEHGRKHRRNLRPSNSKDTLRFFKGSVTFDRNERSNERNIWISHPQPKTKYKGPDTEEVVQLGKPLL